METASKATLGAAPFSALGCDSEEVSIFIFALSIVEAQTPAGPNPRETPPELMISADSKRLYAINGKTDDAEVLGLNRTLSGNEDASSKFFETQTTTNAVSFFWST